MKVKLKDILLPQKKSKIKAGEGRKIGIFKFFTSSPLQTKYYDEFYYDEPALIFGTGGNASIHYCNEKFASSTDCLVMYGKDDINLEFVYYYLEYNIHLLQAGFKGAGLQHISKDYILDISMNLLDINRQMQAVEQIHKILNLIAKRKQQLLILDELVKSRFIEMFGDMFLNTMNWPEVKLNLIADIVSGITKGRKIKEDKLFEVPYMAVSNVKDGYIDWTTVKTILATSTEIKQYRLMPEDVLMTEGGDPDKLGRGAIIHNPPKDCIHQNHIFRVRLKQNFLLPEYMAQYLQHQRSKIYFLKCAKQTTGIASINMRQLSALPILMPPIELQNEFTSFIGQTNKSKFVN